MKKLIVPLFLIISFAFSQYSDLTQGLGFAAGMPSGTGFSYRQMNENHGFQITAGGLAYSYDDEDYLEEDSYYYEDDKNTMRTEGYNNIWGNIGLTYYKPLHRAEKSLFYGFAGISVYYTSEEYMAQDYIYIQEIDSTFTRELIGSEKEVHETNLNEYIGVGLGLSYNITNNIRFSLELPLTVSNEGHIWMIVPQGGLHYFFK